MKNYFSRITADHWQAKNKLEAAAKDLANKMDRYLLREDEIEGFTSEMLNQVKLLNESFSRCKSISITFQEAHKYNENEHDIWIYCPGVFHMSLFEVKVAQGAIQFENSPITDDINCDKLEQMWDEGCSHEFFDTGDVFGKTISYCRKLENKVRRR